MPYCPKCDMEFVDGITTCSDCGGELAPSQEAYEAGMRELKKQQQTEALSDHYQEIEDLDISDFPEQPEEKQEARPRTLSAGIYVSSRQRYEDLRSSSSAFLMVGGAAIVFAAVCWTGIVKLPMAGLSKIFFQTVITVLGLACLFVSLRTRRSITAAQKQAEEEERCTKELIQWFCLAWPCSQLEEELKKEASGLTEEELTLKRLELIQDHLITEQDLPNQAYVDFLSEEIYHILYEKNEVP